MLVWCDYNNNNKNTLSSLYVCLKQTAHHRIFSARKYINVVWLGAGCASNRGRKDLFTHHPYILVGGKKNAKEENREQRVRHGASADKPHRIYRHWNGLYRLYANECDERAHTDDQFRVLCLFNEPAANAMRRAAVRLWLCHIDIEEDDAHPGCYGVDCRIYKYILILRKSRCQKGKGLLFEQQKESERGKKLRT